MRTGASAPLAVSEEAKKRKLTHHSHLTHNNTVSTTHEQEQVIPFVCETYGGLHDDARNVIRQIKLAAQGHQLTYTRKEIVVGLYSSIAVAIQRGNARAVLANIRAAQHPNARYQYTPVDAHAHSSLTLPSSLIPRNVTFSSASAFDPLAYELFTDGASRGNGSDKCLAGAGAILYRPRTSHSSPQEESGRSSVFLGSLTNNQAEYWGLIAGLVTAVSIGVSRLCVYADSDLVINQVMGTFSCFDLELQPMCDTAIALSHCFEHITFTQVMRDENKVADGLANQAVDRGKNDAEVLHQLHLSVEDITEALVAAKAKGSKKVNYFFCRALSRKQAAMRQKASESEQHQQAEASSITVTTTHSGTP